MMNILTTTAGAMVGGIWKIGAIVLAAVSLALCAYLGHGWYMAAHDRDQAIVERDHQKALADEYQTRLREQSTAVDLLNTQTKLAEQRGKAAMDLAAANGRRFDDVLARTRDVKATTCAEAMPVVDQVLEAIK